MTSTTFLSLISPGAVAAEKRYGVPAELCVTQAAIETGWGNRTIGNNWFGIKHAGRHNKSVDKITREVFSARTLENYRRRFPDRVVEVKQRRDGMFDVVCREPFADFDTLTDGCLDYAFMLSGGVNAYKRAWKQFQEDRDVERYARNIAAAYATDPGYGELIVKIMRQVNVKAACKKARDDGEDSDS